MTGSTFVAALLGLGIGNVVAWLVARQAITDNQPSSTRRPMDWLPVGGAVLRHDWFALTVELITAITTARLWALHSFGWKFAVVWLAALVLIDTGAVDWRVKLIDVLILLGATLLALATARLRDLPVIRSFQGLLTAFVLFVLFFVLAKLLYPGQAAPFGLGDVYLGAFIGAQVGFFALPYALFYGMGLAALASFGLIVVRGYSRARHIPISYGTFLCLGTLAYLLR